MEPKFKALQEILELREFPDVFPQDLLGLPLEREIVVCIKLKLGSVPVYKAPYRMVPAKLKELKSQLQEVFNKVFIRPSVSPYGALVYFLFYFKKKKKKRKEKRGQIDVDMHQLSRVEMDYCEEQVPLTVNICFV
jgi:hypothetical protein